MEVWSYVQNNSTRTFDKRQFRDLMCGCHVCCQVYDTNSYSSVVYFFILLPHIIHSPTSCCTDLSLIFSVVTGGLGVLGGKKTLHLPYGTLLSKELIISKLSERSSGRLWCTNDKIFQIKYVWYDKTVLWEILSSTCNTLKTVKPQLSQQTTQS